jgi:iron complex outermembrane receptor protein
MLHTRNKLPKTLLASAIATIIAAPVYAQGGGNVLEEIVVTAQKREESLQDTPISIAAFSQNDLIDMGVFEPGQVGEYTPNLDISRQPSSLDNYGFSIRGIGSGETSLLNENTVGLYLDGVYIARSTGSVFDVVDLERIEVLRGPQGTLYGRNSIGGAVNLITEKPREEFGFQQRLTVGNHGFVRSTSTLDTGKVADMFSAKLTYNYNEKDGTIDNIVLGNKLGDQDSKAYRIALRLEPNDSFVGDYTYDNSKRQSNSALSQIVATRPPMNQIGGAIMAQATAFADPDRLDGLPMAFSPGKDTTSDVYMHTLTLAWNLNDDITLKSITSYRKWESGTTGTSFGSFPSDGATVIDGFTGTYIPAGEYVDVFQAHRDSDNKQWTQEFQLLGDAMDDRLQYTLGLYYFKEESNEDNPQRPTLPAEFIGGRQDQLTKSFLCVDPTFSNPFACIGKDLRLPWSVFQYGAENKSYAAYGQFTYAFSEALDVTVGIRYTEDDKKAYLVNSNIGPQRNQAKDDWNHTDGALTLNYAWTDTLRTYATVSSGYRSGGFGARVENAIDFQDGFDEETVTNYELGLKSEWMDSRLRVNGALFYMQYDDQQVNSFKAGAGGASSVTLNAGEVDISGVELEVTALVTDGLRVILNYGYIDADYQEFLTQRIDPVTALPSPGPDADPITGVEDISDVAVAGRTPENSASAIVSYDFQPFSWGQLNARIEANYRDEMVFHPQLNLYDSTDDQTLINARVTLSDIEILGGNLMVAAWGRNLADEHYREWGIDFATLGFAIDSFKEERTYGVDVMYRFGR